MRCWVWLGHTGLNHTANKSTKKSVLVDLPLDVANPKNNGNTSDLNRVYRQWVAAYSADGEGIKPLEYNIRYPEVKLNTEMSCGNGNLINPTGDRTILVQMDLNSRPALSRMVNISELNSQTNKSNKKLTLVDLRVDAATPKRNRNTSNLNRVYRQWAAAYAAARVGGKPLVFTTNGALKSDHLDPKLNTRVEWSLSQILRSGLTEVRKNPILDSEMSVQTNFNSKGIIWASESTEYGILFDLGEMNMNLFWG